MGLKRLLYEMGIVEDERIAARTRDHEYEYVFCPHCGEFIPHRYNIETHTLVRSGAMQFDCENCGNAGVVSQPVEVPESVNLPDPDIGKWAEQMKEEGVE